MDYYSKKLKYKFKYDSINKFHGGAKIDAMKGLFNGFFGQNWILTGSDAIKKYLEHFGIVDDHPFVVNDIDIFLISREKTISERIFGPYTSVQQQPEKSKTFRNETNGSSFDVTVINSSKKYYEIDGIKLDIPSKMLEQYNEILGEEGRNHESDIAKIGALEEIESLINPANIRTLSIVNKDNKRYRRFEGDENDEGKPGNVPKVSRLFGDNDEDEGGGGGGGGRKLAF
jgi:hypothetical protein